MLYTLNRYRCDVGYSSICCAIAGIKDISIKTIMIYILFMALFIYDGYYSMIFVIQSLQPFNNVSELM